MLALFFASTAQAGLFSDDDARKSIQQVEVRVLKLEKQNKQQTQSILDLQGQIETLNRVIRQLRGQNEETTHGLHDAEKREKDFYVDLDTRLRHFEEIEAKAVALKEAENGAFSAATTLARSGKNEEAAKSLQAFIDQYPNSPQVRDARFTLGNVQQASKQYKTALVTYRALLKSDPTAAKTPDILLNIARCQLALKAVSRARATLKRVIRTYPDKTAAADAKKLLAAHK
ncbi:MAG: tol-pal system protein YbgF [Gallionella sp.]